MAHGGHGKRREAARRGTKGLAIDESGKQKTKKKSKSASIKNQMRSIERLLKKNLSAGMKDAQHKLLEDLKKQAEQNRRAELERKMSLRYRRVKFFERRKIERAIKRIEKLQEAGPDFSESTDMAHKLDTTKELEQLKEDLEYVRFFPKTEKYVSLFMGHDDEEVIAKRSKLREQIKANLAAAAATGIEPEEMENDENDGDQVMDDDFFLAGSSSDDAEADPWSQKDHASSGARRTSDLKNHPLQRPRPQKSPSSTQFHNQRPQSTSRVFKKKAPQFRDERFQSQKGNNKDKRQKMTANASPSGVPFPSHSKSQPACNTSKSAISLKNSAGSSSDHRPFEKNFVVLKKPLPIPEADSLNVDVQKKRRRKHRPKKKKT